jgi:hypothetical protein
LKIQLGDKEKDLNHMQRENDNKISNLTLQAQGAIKHFKDIALSRVGKENLTEFKY